MWVGEGGCVAVYVRYFCYLLFEIRSYVLDQKFKQAVYKVVLSLNNFIFNDTSIIRSIEIACLL